MAKHKPLIPRNNLIALIALLTAIFTAVFNFMILSSIQITGNAASNSTASPKAVAVPWASI